MEGGNRDQVVGMRGPLSILAGLVRGVILLCIQTLQYFAAMARRSLHWPAQRPISRSMRNPLLKSAEELQMRAEEEEEEEEEDDDIFSAATIRCLLGSRSSIELQLLSFMLVFSASGLVPWLDLSFPFFVSIYTYILSRLVFPTYPMVASRMEVFHGGLLFHTFVVVGTLLGFFLPMAFVLGSFSRGEQAAVRSAAPHLFLLTAQIVSELFVSGFTSLSPPCRVILTLLYTSRRLSTLTHWMVDALSHSPPQPPMWHDLLWLWFGRCLPVANFLYCNIYMFYFLIPKFLLRAFERHIIAKSSYLTLYAAESSRHINSNTTSNDETYKDASKDMDALQENVIKRFKDTPKGNEKEKEKSKLVISHDQEPRVTSVKEKKTKDKDKGKQKE